MSLEYYFKFSIINLVINQQSAQKADFWFYKSNYSVSK